MFSGQEGIAGAPPLCLPAPALRLLPSTACVAFVSAETSKALAKSLDTRVLEC